MLEHVRITMERDKERQDIAILVLASDSGMTWRKRYFGDLFLLFDAEALGLIDEAKEHQESPTQSLRKQTAVDTMLLTKLHFTGPGCVT